MRSTASARYRLWSKGGGGTGAHPGHYPTDTAAERCLLWQALLAHATDEGGALLDAVAKARAACRLRFLTGAAAVIYGVPIEFAPRGAGDGAHEHEE